MSGSDFKLVLVGRPNVGKSSLFNRLTGRRLALVDDRPGVTRDRREGEGKLGELRFSVIDTAGFVNAKGDALEARMVAQMITGLDEADLILMVIDARAGVMGLDEQFAQMLRRKGKPVQVLANKCEAGAGQAGFYEAYGLGLGEPIAVSAEHGDGMRDLYEVVRAAMASETDEGEEPETEPEPGLEDDERKLSDRPIRIAVIGRPNAGKSTLINQLIGEERMLTGPEAGITRDAISVEWAYQGQKIKLFDTAGMRKKARISEKLEALSVADGLRAIKFAEVVVVLMDAEAPFEKQDLQLADLVAREGRAIVVALNKWDKITEKSRYIKEIKEKVERLLPQISGVELVTFSALTGKAVDRLMPAVFRAWEIWNTRVSTARLNRWLEQAVQRHTPPVVSGRRIKLRYMTQVKARPPCFVTFCNRPDSLPDSYKRYLINGLRKDLNLPGVPIRVSYKKSKNPFRPEK